MNDLIILGLLFDGPKHGYQLKREAGFLMGQGDMHNNLIYPAMRRFTAAGWVTKKAVPGERGQTRQQYALTAKGRTELIRGLSQYGEDEARSDQGFQVRVGMFALLDPTVRASILGAREEYLRGREGRLKSVKANLEVGTYGAEIINFLVQQAKSEIAFIGRLRRLHKAK